MKFTFLIYLLQLTALTVNAQLISPAIAQDFHYAPVFNEAFLAANRITTIEVEFHSKRDGLPMTPRFESDLFLFDSLGRMTDHQRIRQLSGRPDTSTKVFRNNGCETTIERHNNYLAATRICPSGANSIIEKFTLSAWPATSDLTDQLKVTELFSETVTAETSTGPNHTFTYSNNLGLPFKKIRYTENELGYLTTESEEWLLSGETNQKLYAYNKFGHLETIEYLTGKTLQKTVKLKWDNNGNLLSLDENSPGSSYLTEIIYGSEALIHSYIRVNRETNEMIIARFRYLTKR